MWKTEFIRRNNGVLYVTFVNGNDVRGSVELKDEADLNDFISFIPRASEGIRQAITKSKPASGTIISGP